MKIKKVNELHSVRAGILIHKRTTLIDNDFTKSEVSKGETLEKLRIKLGKSKEQFYRIFELYNQLTKFRDL